MLNDTDAIDDFLMLNSENSLLRVYHRNNRQIERLEEQNTNILPDLLLTDQQQKMCLQDGQNNLQAFTNNLSTEKTPEKE